MPPRSCLAALFTVLIGGAAQAAVVTITISGGDPTTSFQLPLSPTPDYEQTNSYFGFNSVAATVGGAPTTLYQLNFYGVHGGGGLTDSALFDLYSLTSPVQFFSGSESQPTFTPGVYANQFNAFDGQTDTVSITLSTIGSSGGGVLGAPEPAAWALQLIGVGVLGVALRRRRAAADTAAPVVVS